MVKRTASLLAALALASALVFTAFDHAEAGRRHRSAGPVVAGVALGIFALGVAGAYDRSYERASCYKGPRECRWVSGECWYDDDGEKICREGHRECWRPTFCD